MYRIRLQKADGVFTVVQGAAAVVPRADGSFDVAFYTPERDRLKRLATPLHVTGVRIPHVGNPRDGGTCLRAKSLDSVGDWYGCVVRGEVVSGRDD